MSCMPRVSGGVIVVPGASSWRTCLDNEYYVFDGEGREVEYFTAAKRPQVIEVRRGWAWLVHVYTTTRNNAYVTVIRLRDGRSASFSTVRQPTCEEVRERLEELGAPQGVVERVLHELYILDLDEVL